MSDASALVPGIDHVFFTTSSVQAFDNDEARMTFRNRWLGRYLTEDPAFAYVALGGDPDVASIDQRVVGYLVGALDDPARSPRFADLGFFQNFKNETEAFPAQLHVNVLAEVQGRGVGQALVDRFVHDALNAGAPGVHVVTSEGARNIKFYNRCGFHEVAKTDWQGRVLLFLGRSLTSPELT